MSTPLKSATGRRKTAVARVRIAEGSGQIVVNGRAFEDYFTTITLQNQLTVPMQLTNTRQSIDVFANTKGGGINEVKLPKKPQQLPHHLVQSL